MLKNAFAISMLGLVWMVGQAWGTSCSSTSNPCTNGSSSGSDTTDRNTFNSDTLNTAADLSFTNIDFDSITSSSTLNYTSGLLVDGITFTGLDSNGTSPDLYVTDLAAWGSNVVEQHNNGGTITVTIPPSANVFAFGVDLLDVSGLPEPFYLSVNGASQMESAGNPGNLPSSVFFGYTSATPITSVTISLLYSGDQLGIDNFEFGEAPAPTPEVGTLLLIGTGLMLMRFIHRRRTQKPSRAAAKADWEERSPVALSA